MVYFRAVAPILDSTGEQAQAWIIELPLWEEKAEDRHDALCAYTRRIRSENDVASGESLSAGGTWNAARLFAMGARALKRIETGQLAILQSPGSRDPLYLDGARLVECYGILPLQDSSGLGLTVLSYDGSLFFFRHGFAAWCKRGQRHKSVRDRRCQIYRPVISPSRVRPTWHVRALRIF